MSGDSAITVVELSPNSFSTHDGSVDVLSSTAAATIDVSDLDGDRLLIFLDRDSGSATDPTILVEDGGEYSAGAVGNASVVTTAAGEYCIHCETSRFKDSSGKINITKSTTDTTVVKATAILLPSA
jgi:hypothetical protein